MNFVYCNSGHQQISVPNVVRHKVYTKRALIVGRPVWKDVSNIECAFDSLAVWTRTILAQTANDRRILYGDCNIEDAGAYTPGIIPTISTPDETCTFFNNLSRVLITFYTSAD